MYVAGSSAFPTPTFDIPPAKINELVGFFKDLPKKEERSEFLPIVKFMIDNGAMDPRLPSQAYVREGIIMIVEHGKKGETVHVDYEDKHGLYKWLEELYTRAMMIDHNQASAPGEPGDPIGLLLAAMKQRSIRVRLNVGASGPPAFPYSFYLSDLTTFDELAKFFQDLPKTEKPAWAHTISGGFEINARKPGLPWHARVSWGVIEVLEQEGPVYYKDIHGLERWLKELEELYRQEIMSNHNQPDGAERTPTNRRTPPSWPSKPDNFHSLAQNPRTNPIDGILPQLLRL